MPAQPSYLDVPAAPGAVVLTLPDLTADDFIPIINGGPLSAVATLQTLQSYFFPGITIGDTEVIDGTPNDVLTVGSDGTLAQASSVPASSVTIGQTDVSGGISGYVLTVGVDGTMALAASVPASSMASGSAAAPGLPFAAAPDTGIYLATMSGSGFGIAAGGVEVGEFYYRSAGFDNAWLRLGTTSPVSSTTQDTFVATLGTPSLTISGAQPRVVFFNIGTITLTATDTVTKVNQSAMLELDKTDVVAGAGPVIFSNFIGMRVRTPVPHDNVTIAQSSAIEIPYASTIGTGSITNLYALNIVAPSGPNIGTFTGIQFGTKPNGGSIASQSSIDIAMWGGGNIEIVAQKLNTPSGVLTLNAANLGGIVHLQANSKDSLLIEEATTNYLRVGTTGTTPLLRSGGGSTNVPFYLSTKGVAGFAFYQQDQSRQIFSIQQAANAVNRINVVAAASGTPPEVQAAGSTDLDLILRANGTGKVTVASTLSVAGTTARSGMNIGSGSPSAPNSGDFWYDGTNLKFRDGGTTRTLTWV